MTSSPMFEIFTIPRLLFFLAGMVTTCIWHWYRARRRHQSVNFNIVGMIAGIAVIVFIAMQQVTLTTEVKSCQAEFQMSITRYAEISKDNDHWSQVQRTALADWLHGLLNPPPDIRKLMLAEPGAYNADPRYIDWAIGLSQHYDGIIQQAQVEQDENQKEWESHPLPPPNCGIK